MDAWLQVSIAFVVSIIGFFFLWTKDFYKINYLSIFIVGLVVYIVPYALAALFIGEIGFFFSKEYVVKNIFLITTIENLIIAFMLGTWMGDILDYVKNKPQNYKARIIIFIAFTVFLSVFWGIKSYHQIDNKNNTVEVSYIQESVQEQ